MLVATLLQLDTVLPKDTETAKGLFHYSIIQSMFRIILFLICLIITRLNIYIISSTMSIPVF